MNPARAASRTEVWGATLRRPIAAGELPAYSNRPKTLRLDPKHVDRA